MIKPKKVYKTFFSNLEKNKEGWVELKTALPEPFELVRLLLYSGKELKGWWQITDWYARRKSPKDNVIAWKKMYDLK